MVFSSPDSCRSDRPGRTNTSARQMGRLSPGENLGPRCSASQQGCCQGSGRVHPGLTGQLPPHALPEPHGGGIRGSWDSPPPLPPGHRAAVTVRPGPEPRQGGLHPGQLSQDAAHGPDGHAGHDQPRAVPRYDTLRGRGCRMQRVPGGEAKDGQAVSRPRGAGRGVVPGPQSKGSTRI